METEEDESASSKGRWRRPRGGSQPKAKPKFEVPDAAPAFRGTAPMPRVGAPSYAAAAPPPPMKNKSTPVSSSDESVDSPESGVVVPKARPVQTPPKAKAKAQVTPPGKTASPVAPKAQVTPPGKTAPPVPPKVAAIRPPDACPSVAERTARCSTGPTSDEQKWLVGIETADDLDDFVPYWLNLDHLKKVNK